MDELSLSFYLTAQNSPDLVCPRLPHSALIPWILSERMSELSNLNWLDRRVVWPGLISSVRWADEGRRSHVYLLQKSESWYQFF